MSRSAQTGIAPASRIGAANTGAGGVRSADGWEKWRRMKKKEPILCYVSGPWAYFTTQSLKKQWGDDWNDRPYEHNAGIPYGPHEGDKPWEIISVAWHGDFDQPCEGMFNSCWSVQDINNKCVPWLRTSKWCKEPVVLIWAETPLSEFKKLIRQGGGSVYVEET